jgi:hypothetical protein
MTTHRHSRPPIEAGPALNAADVAAWLRLHPEFFAEHPALLTDLRLPHIGAQGAVSLIERQVALLRDKNQQLERKLGHLLAVARDNEKLNQRLQNITLALLAAPGLAALCGVLERDIREHFEVPHCALRLLAAPGTTLAQAICGLARDTDAGQALEEFLGQAKPACGRVPAAWLEAALGATAANCQSALLLPVQAGGLSGVLALGSPDPQRFQSGMATDYLQGLASLVGLLVAREL